MLSAKRRVAEARSSFFKRRLLSQSVAQSATTIRSFWACGGAPRRARRALPQASSARRVARRGGRCAAIWRHGPPPSRSTAGPKAGGSAILRVAALARPRAAEEPGRCRSWTSVPVHDYPSIGLFSPKFYKNSGNSIHTPANPTQLNDGYPRNESVPWRLLESQCYRRSGRTSGRLGTA